MTFEMMLLEQEEKGIGVTVKTYKKFGLSKEDAIRGIMDEFSLSQKASTEKVAMYWK